MQSQALGEARRVLLGVTACLAGAIAFSALGIVLPWMLGPLVAMAAANIARWPVARPRGGLQTGQLVIGAALGLYFTAPVSRQMLQLAPAIAVTAVFAYILAGVCAVLLRRLSGCDSRTAFFGSLPGGAAEMAVLADRFGGRGDWVAAAQAVRVLLVVLSVPALLTWSGGQGVEVWTPATVVVRPAGLAALIAVAGAAALLLRYFQTPNAWLLGPLLAALALTAAGVDLSAMPRWLVNAAQLLVGCTLGSRFNAEFFRRAPRLLISVAACVVIGIALSAGFALALARLMGTDAATTILATAPGGVAEMSITAQVLRLGVPVVAAFHVSRLAFLVLTAGPVFKLVLRLRAGSVAGR